MAKKQSIDVAGSVCLPDSVHVGRHPKEQTLEKLKELMKEESKMVRGVFQCFETPGATQKITYKKYPTPAEMRKRGTDGGVEPFSKTMTDGQEYEIPLYVARFLNGTDVSACAMDKNHPNNHYVGTCSFNVHGFKMAGESLAPSQGGDAGIPVPIVGVVKRTRRYGFQSLEFAHGAV